MTQNINRNSNLWVIQLNPICQLIILQDQIQGASTISNVFERTYKNFFSADETPMNLQAKRLLGGRKQLCLIISLGNGIRVQHPVLDESEAIEIYSYYSKLNPYLQQSAAIGSSTKPALSGAAV